MNIWLKVLSFIFVLSGFFYFTFNTEVVTLLRSGDIQSIQYAMKGNFFYFLLISLLAMIIQNTFTLIPLILLITLNTTLFGFFNGFIWSWFTSIIAAIIVFIGIRYYFQDWVLKKVKPNLIAKVDQVGLLYVFEARIFPFVPTSAVNIVAGVSSIRFKSFLIGTIVGNFIYFFVLSLIPLGILTLNIDEYVLGIIIILSILLFYLVKGISSRKKQNKLDNMIITNLQEKKGTDENY